MDNHIFSGLKVIDCAGFIAAPAAATVLGDFGADVVKIEPPGTGDAYRHLPKLPGNPVSEHNFAWLLDSRNKRSIAVDLANPDGQAVVQRLASDADVFITNFPLHVRGRFGIDYETLGQRNDRLIYASFTGYGETGEEASKPGFDTTAWWARSGMMDIVRTAATDAPVRPAVGMGDHPSAVSVYAAIVTALYQRERTGRGAYVTSSLVANGLWANAYVVQAALCGATMIPRPPRVEALNALTTYYRCRDGLWLILTLLNEERHWPVLARCMDREDLVADPRFATKADRLARSSELVGVLDEIFATRERAEWRKILHDNGIIFEVVATPDEIPHDEQLEVNGFVVPMEDGAMMTVASPLAIAGADKVIPRRPPEIGEHTDDVLREAGYGLDEITNLREIGAVS
jgi:crotonobetainyl-CoA:carnitine CoA-transferase CaiB-like acyl-CoA transferase